MLYSESMAQQLNFPLCLQNWKSFIALKHTVVQVSSSLQWGNTHIGTTLDSLSQIISMLYELPGSLKRNSEEQAECSNPRSKSEDAPTLGQKVKPGALWDVLISSCCSTWKPPSALL